MCGLLMFQAQGADLHEYLLINKKRHWEQNWIITALNIQTFEQGSDQSEIIFAVREIKK